jgi:hypothetical protein
MHDLSTDMWLRLGTGLIWDAQAQHVAARAGRTVSLRAALHWAGMMPDDTPGGVRTILVTGLQMMLDVLSPTEADPVLARVRMLIRRKSDRWPECALLFAMPDAKRLQLDPATQAIMWTFPGHDKPDIDIGARLWSGAARDASRIVETRPDAKGKLASVPVGFWLRRVS